MGTAVPRCTGGSPIGGQLDVGRKQGESNILSHLTFWGSCPEGRWVALGTAPGQCPLGKALGGNHNPRGEPPPLWLPVRCQTTADGFSKISCVQHSILRTSALEKLQASPTLSRHNFTWPRSLCDTQNSERPLDKRPLNSCQGLPVEAFPKT